MFSFEIIITPVVADALKRDLQIAAPQIKSSHRVEALARGLGFKSQAALLAAVRSEPSQRAHLNGPAFSSYLAAHGFDSACRPLYIAAAQAAVRTVMAKEERLCWRGLGVGAPQWIEPGRWESPAEQWSRFLDDRNEMLDATFAGQFLQSLAFLERVKRTKTIRGDTNSYRLKHIAEVFPCTYPDGEELGPGYVPNGALITAAIHAGFIFRPERDGPTYTSPNAYFNMSERCLEDLDCEFRPDGAKASDRRARLAARSRRWMGGAADWV